MDELLCIYGIRSRLKDELLCICGIRSRLKLSIDNDLLDYSWELYFSVERWCGSGGAELGPITRHVGFVVSYKRIICLQQNLVFANIKIEL